MKKGLFFTLVIGLMLVSLKGVWVTVHYPCFIERYQQFLELKAHELLMLSHPTATLVESQMEAPDQMRIIYAELGGFGKRKWLILRIQPSMTFERITAIAAFDEGVIKPFMLTESIKQLLLQLHITPNKLDKLLSQDTEHILTYYLTSEWQKFLTVRPCEPSLQDLMMKKELRLYD